MHVRIEGHDLPGRRFTSDGEVLTAVHVGVQRGREPEGLVAGDAATATWSFDVAVRPTDDGPDLSGPHVQGGRAVQRPTERGRDGAPPGGGAPMVWCPVGGVAAEISSC